MQELEACTSKIATKMNATNVYDGDCDGAGRVCGALPLWRATSSTRGPALYWRRPSSAPRPPASRGAPSREKLAGRFKHRVEGPARAWLLVPDHEDGVLGTPSRRRRRGWGSGAASAAPATTGARRATSSTPGRASTRSGLRGGPAPESGAILRPVSIASFTHGLARRRAARADRRRRSCGRRAGAGRRRRTRRCDHTLKVVERAAVLLLGD